MLKSSLNLAAITLMALAVFSSGCVHLPTLPTPKKTALVAEKPVYDFSYAGPSQTIMHEFKLANPSGYPTVIEAISVCCGCWIKSRFDPPETIGPGKHRNVRVVCQMPRYEGPVEKVINLITGAQKTDTLALTIKGSIVRQTQVLPEALFFGPLKKGAYVGKKVRMLQMPSKKLRIRKISANRDFYRINLTPFKERNHRGYEIFVGFSARRVETGTYNDVITIHTNDARKPKIDIPVLIQVVK